MRFGFSKLHPHNMANMNNLKEEREGYITVATLVSRSDLTLLLLLETVDKFGLETEIKQYGRPKKDFKLLSRS